LGCKPIGGLFGLSALTPSGPPSLRSGVPQPALQVSVEPLSVQILFDLRERL